MKKTLKLLLISMIWVISGNFVSAQDFEDVVLTTPPSNFRITGNSNSLITTFCGSTTGTQTLPIVIWVVNKNATTQLVTQTQIDSAIIWLNRDFNNSEGFAPSTGMNFALAKRDPNGNTTSGVKHVDGSILPAYSTYGVNVVSSSTGFSVYEFGNYNLTWDHNKYINVYIVDSIFNGYGGVTANIPSFFGEGVFIKASEIPRNMHSLTHEMGHYFNLLHTFEGSSGFNCPVNNNCATNGDKNCDTPPHRSIDAFLTTPCYAGSDVLNSLQNFVSYGSIKNRFTAGQTVIMRDYLFNTRSGLITGNDALSSPTAPVEVVLTAIENQPVTYACGNADFQFTVKNGGLNNLTSFKVKIYSDDVLVSSPTLSASGMVRGESKTFTVTIPITLGSHTLRAEISDPNGTVDGFIGNNQLCKAIDFQKKMFYVAAIGNADVSTTGTGNYLCYQQVNFEASYDTSLFDFDAWRDEVGQTHSVSRYWSFNADSSAYFMPSVKPKKITAVINHGGQDNSVKIYPNPATDQLTVELRSQSLSKSQIEIIDITGRIVIAQDFSTRSSNVDISQLSAGEYIVRITDDQGFFVTKILKN